MSYRRCVPLLLLALVARAGAVGDEDPPLNADVKILAALKTILVEAGHDAEDDPLWKGYSRLRTGKPREDLRADLRKKLDAADDQEKALGKILAKMKKDFAKGDLPEIRSDVGYALLDKESNRAKEVPWPLCLLFKSCDDD